MTYSDPQTQHDLLELEEKFENTSYVASTLYSESWLKAWLNFLDRNQEYLNISVATEEEFCQQLRDVNLYYILLLTEDQVLQFQHCNHYQ